MRSGCAKAVLAVLLLLLGAGTLPAEEGGGEPGLRRLPGNDDAEGAPDWYARFQPYKMNYALWQYTANDDYAAEVQYSFKYLINDPTEENRLHSFYLSYTGKFDFYMGTRYSSPVINRTSNPAFHYRYLSSARELRPFWLDIGVEHRSNGQVTEVTVKDENPSSPTYGQYLTEIEYQKGNHEYFDGISRGANYVSISPCWRFRAEDRDNIGYDQDKIEAEGKIYFSNDSRITWGEYAGSDRRIYDYDLVRLHYSHTQKFRWQVMRHATVGFDYLFGRKGVATDSVDLYAITPLYVPGLSWRIPLIVKAHFGPMERLSDYTRPMRSVGIGLALAY